MASKSEATYVLGTKISSTSYGHAAESIGEWARQRVSRYVCLATVNEIMQAYDSAQFQSIMNEADLVTPDGMPLVWASRLLGRTDATRVYGPDLTLILLQMAASRGFPVGFFGGTPAALGRLTERIAERFPAVQIAYAWSPPFRALTQDEDRDVTAAINRSGARIVFIGLSSPNQNYWMAAHRGQINSVLVGVGAAFDFLSGSKPQAPRWMMRVGLEWLFRLLTEPRRLWKRYLKHNPRFVGLFALQLLGLRHFQPTPIDTRQIPGG